MFVLYFVVYFVNSLFLCCCGIVSPFVYSCFFPIIVQVYSLLSPGGNPIAVNKYHHQIYVSSAVAIESLKNNKSVSHLNFILASSKLQSYLCIGKARDLEFHGSGTFQNILTSSH
jgi:hypothetical protein